MKRSIDELIARSSLGRTKGRAPERMVQSVLERVRKLDMMRGEPRVDGHTSWENGVAHELRPCERTLHGIPKADGQRHVALVPELRELANERLCGATNKARQRRALQPVQGQRRLGQLQQVGSTTRMADDKNKRGKPDSDLASQQKHEIDYLVRKHELPAPLIRKIVEQEGPSHRQVERYLEQMKRNRK